MSDQEHSQASPSRSLPLIGLVVLVFVIGAAAFAWARSTAEGGEASGRASGPLVSAVTLSAEEPSLDSGAAPVVATASPPQLPTPVATSAPTDAPLPTFSNPADESYVQEAAAWNVPLDVIDQTVAGVWAYAPDSFVHPIALQVGGDSAFLLDGGRVLQFGLADPVGPTLLLAPGDVVSGIRVIEPVDLAANEETLFVLDRAGDVYRYDIRSHTWENDRYDRPSEESSGHYFVAIDTPGQEIGGSDSMPARSLLETNYGFVAQYGGERDSLWNLPEGRSVDIGVFDGEVFVLQQEMSGGAGVVLKYQDTRFIEEFKPTVEIDRPRQIAVAESGVFVKDRGGRRLLVLDPQSGRLLKVLQLPQEEMISAFALDELGRLYLAGRNRLFWVGQAEKLASISGGPKLGQRSPHDPYVLQTLDDFSVPIGGTNITNRDFQMPGAPRHYRLGVHEGLDFYWHPGTKVIAAGDGTVVRADLNYVGPTALELATWWNETQELGYTTPERLDDYLGRQVWIDHGQGIISRYGHLRAIEPGIAEGVQVKRGQVIGEVGNSGSPASLESESSDAHLHFELWLGDNYLGQYMRPIEIREWVEQIFSRQMAAQ